MLGDYPCEKSKKSPGSGDKAVAPISKLPRAEIAPKYRDGISEPSSGYWAIMASWCLAPDLDDTALEDLLFPATHSGAVGRDKRPQWSICFGG